MQRPIHPRNLPIAVFFVSLVFVVTLSLVMPPPDPPTPPRARGDFMRYVPVPRPRKKCTIKDMTATISRR